MKYFQAPLFSRLRRYVWRSSIHLRSPVYHAYRDLRDPKSCRTRLPAASDMRTRDMLVLALLLFATLQVVFAFGGIPVQESKAVLPFWPLIPRMPRSRELVYAAAAPVALCVDIDIEELPAGLAEGYKRHQAVEYHAFTAEEVVTIRRDLLSWYGKNRRTLPWRGDPPPWTRTATTSNITAGRKNKAPAAKKDAAQPRLTAFFDSKPKETPPAAGTSSSGRGGRSATKGEKAEAGGGKGKAKGKAKLENDNVNEEQQDSLKTIPMSAYGTWVSEVMLQQTRVETVVDYFVKWMTLFPNPKALAEADLEQVNKAWAGLGYYRRAKMLHEGAKKVMADYGGSLPRTAKELKELPGIGPYTAGAVASIAFGECESLVDGNVIRVLSRLKAVASDPKNAGLNKLCWDLAGSIVDPKRPGDFNQALMELGATVCSVKSPSCSTCPLRISCLAHELTADGPKGPRSEASSEEGVPAVTIGNGGSRKRAQSLAKISSEDKATLFDEQNACGCAVCEVGEDGMAVMPMAVTDYPRKAPKTMVKDQVLSVSVVERDGPRGPQVLLVKRPDTGLLAGQWECPCVILRDGSESAKAAGVNAKEENPTSEVPDKERLRAANGLLFSDLGLSKAQVRSRAGIGSVTHIFSHLRHNMQVERIALTGDPNIDDNTGTNSSREIRWVDVSDMGGLGITTGMKKVVALASKARTSSKSNSSYCSSLHPSAGKKTKRVTVKKENTKKKEHDSNADTKRKKAENVTRTPPPASVKTTRVGGRAVGGRRRRSDDCSGSEIDEISNARSRSNRTRGGGGTVGP